MVGVTRLCYVCPLMGAGLGHGTDGDEDYTPLVPQVRVRIGVECATVAEFVERYCRFVDGDRIFIATDVVETIGSLVQFRVDLINGRAAVHGTGTVLETRAEASAGAPRGMLLRFVALDEASARVIEAMASRRARSTPAFVLPANPFGDVPDDALAYFVDWSLERNGSAALRRGPAAVAFHEVRMEAPRRRRRRLPSWVPFVVGLATGGVGIVAVIHGTQELDRALRPRALVPAIAAPPSPAAHSPSPRPPSPLPLLPPSSETAPLTVAAEPGATVTIDGRRVGRTPLTLPASPGTHVVELSRPRYQTVRLEVAAPGRASARLERPRATVHVTSNVADADVFVDGEPIGRAPVSAEVAGYERCRIEVRAGGRSWKRRVYVKPPLTDLAATFAFE
jgi:hypothetical protein